MDLETVLAAEAAQKDLAAKANEMAQNTIEFVRTSIIERESKNALTKHKLVQISNNERVHDIKESRVPKTEANTLKDILNRVSGKVTAPKGNIVLMAIALDESSSANDFVEQVTELEGVTAVLTVDLFAMNAQSDKQFETLDDKKLLDIVDDIAILESKQAGLSCDVLAKRQPFSDIFNAALKSI